MPPRPPSTRESPPHNLEAEESVLGACLLSKQVLPQVAELLGPSDSYRPGNQTIYRAILALHEQGQPVDAITVGEELRREGVLEEVGGPPYLFTVINSVSTPGSGLHYARIVRENALRREVQDFGQILTLAATQTDPSKAVSLARNFFDGVRQRIDEDAEAAGTPHGCSASELLAMQLRDPWWLIPGILPASASAEAVGLAIGRARPAHGRAAAGSAGHAPSAP